MGHPADVHEQEAQRIADEVMRTPAPGIAAGNRPSSWPLAHSEKALRGLGPGEPLDPRVRASFESRFAHDFSEVRIHTGARAADSARSIDAEAYTVGPDVVFGAGGFAPETSQGQRTLAHELAHVLQQGRSLNHAGAKGLGLSSVSPRIQRKLALTGSSANVGRVIMVMSQGLGPVHEARLNSAGEVEIVETGAQGPPTRENQFFINRLGSLVTESETTTVSVVAGGVPIVGSYALSQIDIADIEQLGIGQVGWDARAALLHELVEQRERQLGTTPAQRGYGSTATGAHGVALAAELGMIGAKLDSDTGLVGATTNPDGTLNGSRTVVFSYPDGTRYRVEVTLSRNNITGVTRTRLP